MIPKQCLARCLRAQPESGLDETDGEPSEQCHREATALSECSYVPCQRPAQSHAASLLPSIASTHRSSQSQKAQIVSQASCLHHLSKADLYQMVLHRPIETAAFIRRWMLLGVRCTMATDGNAPV